MHQPTDVRGQLLRFRPRQHHAIVERVQKAPLGNPPAALHQFVMHHTDLTSWPAEADKTEFEPVRQRFSEGNRHVWSFTRSQWRALCPPPCSLKRTNMYGFSHPWQETARFQYSPAKRRCNALVISHLQKLADSCALLGCAFGKLQAWGSIRRLRACAPLRASGCATASGRVTHEPADCRSNVPCPARPPRESLNRNLSRSAA